MAQDTRGAELRKQFLVEYVEGEVPSQIGNLGENEITGFDIFLIIVLSASSELEQINELLDTLWNFRRRNWLLIYPEIYRKYIEEYLRKSYEVNNWEFGIRYFSPKYENREQLKKFVADRLSIEAILPIQRVESEPYPPQIQTGRSLYYLRSILSFFLSPFIQSLISLISSILITLALLSILNSNYLFNILENTFSESVSYDPSCPSKASQMTNEGTSCLQRDEVVQIGGTLSLSGQHEEIGADYLQGFNLCADDMNAEGGLLGKPMVFLIEDDESDAALSRELYQQLITEEKVDLIIGPYSSAITLQASQVAAEHHYPMIAPGASNPTIWQQGNQYVFALQATAGRDDFRGAMEIARREELSKIAILAQSGESFTSAVLHGTRDLLFEYEEMELVYQGGYEYKEDQNGQPSEETRQQIAEAVQMAQERRAEVVLMATLDDDAALIVQEAQKIGFQPHMFVLTTAPALPEFTEKLGDDAELIFGTSEWHRSLNTPGIDEFVEAYQKRFAEEPSHHAASAYGACQLLQQAVKNVDSLNQELIRDQLQQIETETVFGPYKVDETGQQIGKPVYLIQVQNGNAVLVWPFLNEEPAYQLP